MFTIYRVKDDYVKYLQKYEPKVLDNKSQKRPYIGVTHIVNDIQYFIPLSSPKPKHKTMKNMKDFHKVNEGEYGAINFNKMIPVFNEVIIQFNIQDEPDDKYRNLLQNQYRSILDIKDVILKKSTELYELFHADNDTLNNNELKVKDRCCNFSLLEKIYIQYKPTT